MADEAEEMLIPTTTIEAEAALSMDNVELASGYITAALPHKPVLRIGRLAGYSLPEPEKVLYIKMRELISAVANGSATSTVFSFPVAEVFTKIKYTADELGVDSILKEDGTWNPDALTAIGAIQSSLDIPAVVHCLMYDSPYEMYWFGKRYQYSMGGISGTSQYLTLTGNVTISMNVSVDYASKDTEGNYEDYSVDPIYGTAVTAAASTARDILDRYETLDNYNRLKGYRDEICNLTDYNTEAAKGDMPYGDPWQLIWVFDNDPSTKVVCEGYSKAFQYLNDMSSGSAEVISCQGSIEAGAHMWNIVTIDGNNYLADITNCDHSDRDMLFLKGNIRGSVENGYVFNYYDSTIHYIYDMDQRSEEELTIESFDYLDWRAAAMEIPQVEYSSTKSYPGYGIAVKVVTPENTSPTKLLVQINGNEEQVELNEGAGVFELQESANVAISAMYGETISAGTEPQWITVEPLPEQQLLLPANSLIEEEAFAETGATMITAENVTIERNAFNSIELAVLHGMVNINSNSFNNDVILAVDEINYELPYEFIVNQNE